MKLGKIITLFLFFQVGVVSAEVIEIKNNVPFRKSYDLTGATIFKIESSNGVINLLPAEDGKFTIEASASGFNDHAKVDVEDPIDGKFKFQLINSQAGGSRLIGNVIVGGNVMIGGSYSSITVYW
jgi:hypothetical protein